MHLSSVHPYRVCILGVLLLTAVTPAGNASEPDVAEREPIGELTLRGALDAALARNPDLEVSSYELLAAEARITQAKLRPNPELSAEFENFAGSGELQGTDALESTLSLGQLIELGDKRRRRTDLAVGERELAEIEQQARELDVLAEVARQYVVVLAAQRRLELAGNTREVAQRTFDAIKERVRAARSPEAERSRARITLTRALIEERQAQSELRSARYALAALWGSAEPKFTEATADLLALGEIQAFEGLLKRLERNPDFIRFASEARLREAELRLAQAQARPDLTLGIGVRRLEEAGENALVAGFSMPLPVFDRNRGAIRQAEIRRTQTAAAREAAFVRARATVYGLYQELVATRARVDTLRADALPQAQEALEQTRFGYERGRFSYLELAIAQQELLELRAAIIDAAADYHRAFAEIERLTGEPLTPSKP